MLNIEGKKIYLACGGTDLRRSINGLTMMVESVLELNPFDEAIFIFCNRSKSLIKILEWDRDGFWLHVKRLDNGKFKWPEKQDKYTMELSYEYLTYLLGSPKIERKIKNLDSSKIFY